MYFRARVYAQAFTLLCICVGSVYWKEDRDKRKHYTGLLAEKRAQEKRDAWIRELEARDREDAVEREKKGRRREVRRQAKEKADAEGVLETKGALEAKPAVDANSALTDEEVAALLGTTRILGPAVMLWRWRKGRDTNGD